MVPLSLPEGMWDVFFTMTTPTSPELENIFSFDCLIQKSGVPPINSTHLSLIILFSFNIFFGAFYLFYLFFKKKSDYKFRVKTFLRTGIRIYGYLVLMNIVGLLQPLLNQLFCIEVSDPKKLGNSELRLMKDPRISCLTPEQYAIQYYISIPTALLIGVCVPAIYSFLNYMKFRKNLLYTPEELGKYGYFYYQYKPKFFFFDIVVYLKRITILVLQILLMIATVP